MGIAEYIGSCVYRAYLPTQEDFGARTYFRDLWREGAKKAAMIHFLLAMLVFFLPVFVLMKPKLLSSLNSDERKTFLERLNFSSLYPLRLIACAVRSHAMLAILRHGPARRELLTE